MDFEIGLIEKEEMEVIIPLLQQLNPAISYEILKKRLQEMLLQNYQCVGAYHGVRLVGISGIWMLTKYYVGKHFEPDNVFVLPEYQGKGVGQQLFDWIFGYAKSKGCTASELNCYTSNETGQRFWEKQGYELVAYHYQKKL